MSTINYFVAYNIPYNGGLSVGNVDLHLHDEIDTYDKVQKISRMVEDRLREQNRPVVAPVVVTNWIVLKDNRPPTGPVTMKG